MHARKGSFTLTQPRGRRQLKWSGLLILLFVSLLYTRRSEFSSTWFIPAFPRTPASLQSCPTKPPYPPLVPPPSDKFSWRSIPQQYPVETFAQLPAGRKKKLSKIQFDFQNEEAPLYHELMRKRRQAAVKTTFQRCWKSYKARAWGRDELTPISGRWKTTFGGWGATLVDSLDTLLIMDLKEEFHDAVDAVTTINFKPGEGEINMFETTIRYLGGLLSAYDLSDCKDSRLLEKAMELGDMIYASFDTPNRMPITRWNAKKAFNGEKQEAASNGIIAEMASFSLEFTRLSQITGDMRYYDAVKRIANVLDEQQSQTKLPGLWPVGINVQKPDLTTGNLFSLGAMADSAYEYLGKTYQLLHGLGADASQYKKLYTSAMDAIIPNLLFHPMTPDNASILMPTSARVESASSITQDHSTQHLVCYVGGMLALGGRLFNNDTHVSYGKKVTDGCIWAYKNAPNGIMPEMFSMPACPFSSPCPYDPSIRQQHPGFSFISDARYLLRPEAIESVFYMYRITGDRTYQDIAWDMFQAIDTLSRTEFANAAIRDVTRKEVGLEDNMESFWLAETLKYFYLVFSETGLVGLDEWVFNTEAHPFRVV